MVCLIQKHMVWAVPPLCFSYIFFPTVHSVASVTMWLELEFWLVTKTTFYFHHFQWWGVGFESHMWLAQGNNFYAVCLITASVLHFIQVATRLVMCILSVHLKVYIYICIYIFLVGKKGPIKCHESFI